MIWKKIAAIVVLVTGMGMLGYSLTGWNGAIGCVGFTIALVGVANL